MHVAVYLPFVASLGVLALLLPHVGGRWADAAGPRVAAGVLVTSMALLGLTGVVVLALLVACALAQWPAVAAWGHWPVAPLVAGDRHAGGIGAVAAVLLTVLLGRVVATATRLHRQYREAAPTGTEVDGVVVVDDPWPVAHARPARGRRGGVVVVSRAMLEVLPPREREALLAHERAHLAGRHHLFLAAAALATAANPLLSAARTELAFALERCADAAAARAVGSPIVTARAIGRAALAGPSARTGRSSLASAATSGPVPRRVAVLIGATQGRPWWSWIVLGAIALAALAAAVATTHATGDLLEMLHHARSGLADGALRQCCSSFAW